MLTARVELELGRRRDLLQLQLVTAAAAWGGAAIVAACLQVGAPQWYALLGAGCVGLGLVAGRAWWRNAERIRELETLT